MKPKILKDLLHTEVCDTDVRTEMEKERDDERSGNPFFSRSRLDEPFSAWRCNSPHEFSLVELLELKAKTARKLQDKIEKGTRLLEDIDTLLDEHFDDQV